MVLLQHTTSLVCDIDYQFNRMQADGFQNSPFGNTGGDSDSEQSLKLNDRSRFCDFDVFSDYAKINSDFYLSVLSILFNHFNSEIRSLKLKCNLFDAY